MWIRGVKDEHGLGQGHGVLVLVLAPEAGVDYGHAHERQTPPR